MQDAVLSEEKYSGMVVLGKSSGSKAQQEIQQKLLFYRAIRACIYTITVLCMDQSVHYYIQ